jgi:hypothetical protein
VGELMTHSECVYVRLFTGNPVDRLQTGELFLKIKKHLNFSKGKNVKKVRFRSHMALWFAYVNTVKMSVAILRLKYQVLHLKINCFKTEIVPTLLHYQS